jgi:hypothetical protein
MLLVGVAHVHGHVCQSPYRQQSSERVLLGCLIGAVAAAAAAAAATAAAAVSATHRHVLQSTARSLPSSVPVVCFPVRLVCAPTYIGVSLMGDIFQSDHYLEVPDALTPPLYLTPCMLPALPEIRHQYSSLSRLVRVEPAENDEPCPHARCHHPGAHAALTSQDERTGPSRQS